MLLSTRRRLLVDDGQVGCPTRGTDVDVETCLACVDYVGMQQDGERDVVVCRTRGGLLTRPIPGLGTFYGPWRR